MTDIPVDRLSIRKRPEQAPLMYQSWVTLLFMHWRLPPELLRPHVPPELEIDTYGGEAWIAITPFAVKNLHLFVAPSVPWMSDFAELNVRTYVVHDGVPGVWFFSLDADSTLAVMGARTFFHLPYHNARMELHQEQGAIFYRCARSGSSAEFTATWKPGGIAKEAAPDSLEFFLVERYCLYAIGGKKLYRARVFHEPWHLQGAELSQFKSNMLQAQGLPSPEGAPLLHYSESEDVAVWPLEKLY